MNKKVKLPLFTDNIIVYVENLKESIAYQKNIQNLIYETGEVQNIQSVQNANKYIIANNRKMKSQHSTHTLIQTSRM